MSMLCLNRHGLSVEKLEKVLRRALMHALVDLSLRPNLATQESRRVGADMLGNMRRMKELDPTSVSVCECNATCQWEMRGNAWQAMQVSLPRLSAIHCRCNYTKRHAVRANWDPGTGRA
jgi:hypothetical protein